jgi:hypothetical protein
MLPNEALSATVLSGTFLSPRTDLRNPNLTNALVAYHIGGVAVNDPSQGLLYQTWQGTYDGTYVNVQGLTNLNTYAAVGPLANIQWFDFAFDNAMRPYVVYVDVALNSWLYYYHQLELRPLAVLFYGRHPRHPVLGLRRDCGVHPGRGPVLFGTARRFRHRV